MNSMDMAQGSNVAHPFTPFCHEFSGKWRCFYIYVRPGEGAGDGALCDSAVRGALLGH